MQWVTHGVARHFVEHAIAIGIYKCFTAHPVDDFVKVRSRCCQTKVGRRVHHRVARRQRIVTGG